MQGEALEEKGQEIVESGRAFSLRFAKNSIVYFASQVVGKGLFFLTTVYLARKLGAVEYGKFAFSFGFVTLFSVVAKFGLDLLTSRDVGEKPQLAGKYLHATLTLRLLLSAGYIALILIAVLIIPKEFEVKLLILLLALSAALQCYGGAGTALFEGLQLFRVRSILNLVVYGFIFVALLIATQFSTELASAGIAFLIGTFLYCAVSLALCHRLIAPLGWSRDYGFVWSLFKAAVPLGLMEIFIGIYYRLDTVMLSFFSHDAVVGWYDAAYTFVYGLRLLPVTAAMVLLPGLSNLYSKNSSKGLAIYNRIFYYSIAAGACITFLVAAHAYILVSFVFGRGYENAAPVLGILIWTCLIMFANAFQAIFLLVTQQGKFLFRATAFGATSNLILNLLLIPKWNMYGAAIATILSEFVVFLSCAVYLRRFVKFQVVGKFALTPVAGLILMYALWTFSKGTNVLVQSILCITGYAVLVFVIHKRMFRKN